MMRSMFSGVSGLRAHQVKMDVIGNNIANVNTVGYKGSKVTFAEVFSQTVKGASGSTDQSGGTNPQQIGLGIQIGSMDVIHSKGSSQRTDNATDLMIDGNGFFVVSPDAAGQNKFFTRAGNFNFDEKGYLVTANGYKVFGQKIETKIGADGTPVDEVMNEFGPIQINKSETKGAKATTTHDVTAAIPTTPPAKSPIFFSGNIDVNEKEYKMTFDVYDSLGRLNTVKADFGVLDDTPDAGITGANAAVKSTREVTFTPLKADGTPYMQTADPTLPVTVTATMGFDGEGNAITLTDAAGGPVATTLNIVDAASDTPTNASNNMSFVIDEKMLYVNGDNTSTSKKLSFKQVRMASDAKVTVAEGRAAGAINSFSIGQDGKVQALFTNGERQTVGRLKLADFDNPGGLMKIGNNMFNTTPNSGAAKFGTPNSGSFGALTPGALEMSNVDLAAEFTDMITTQRGFQANSRIITTSDEILQELVNLKR